MVILSILLVLLWPFTQDRLLLGVLPFASLLAAKGMNDLGQRVPSWGRYCMLTVLIASVGVLAYRQVWIRRDTYARLEIGEMPAGSFTPTAFLRINSSYLERVVAWVHDHTHADDRVLVEHAAGLYLFTGRKAVTSEPAEPRGRRSAFAIPGNFLARRILEDDVTVVVLGSPAFPIARDIQFVDERCPGVLRYLDRDKQVGFPVFFRVVRDDPCIRDRVLGVHE